MCCRRSRRAVIAWTARSSSSVIICSSWGLTPGGGISTSAASRSISCLDRDGGAASPGAATWATPEVVASTPCHRPSAHR
jgi:hypothetical protein